jgi:hypothetical protein
MRKSVSSNCKELIDYVDNARCSDVFYLRLEDALYILSKNFKIRNRYYIYLVTVPYFNFNWELARQATD